MVKTSVTLLVDININNPTNEDYWILFHSLDYYSDIKSTLYAKTSVGDVYKYSDNGHVTFFKFSVNSRYDFVALHVKPFSRINIRNYELEISDFYEYAFSTTYILDVIVAKKIIFEVTPIEKWFNMDSYSSKTADVDLHKLYTGKLKSELLADSFSEDSKSFPLIINKVDQIDFNIDINRTGNKIFKIK